jgi:hypothetical protein
MTNLLKIFSMSQGYIIYIHACTFCGGGVRMRLPQISAHFRANLPEFMRIAQDFTEGVSYLHL